MIVYNSIPLLLPSPKQFILSHAVGAMIRQRTRYSSMTSTLTMRPSPTTTAIPTLPLEFLPNSSYLNPASASSSNKCVDSSSPIYGSECTQATPRTPAITLLWDYKTDCLLSLPTS